MPTAVLFPGQGSQVPGMRELVAAHAPELLERCVELVGTDPFPRVGESTRFAQPAIFCASVAGWRRLARELEAPPAAVAGHSLGEPAALVAAGVLDELAALELVVLRGWAMAEAGGGTMLALLGADDETAEAIAHAHGVTVANYNAPGQVVLSGGAEALDAAAREARAHGHRAMELGVAGAFHSPAMAAAVEPFAAALARIDFRPPRDGTTVLSCHTARPMTDPRRELAEALTGPVRWAHTMRALEALGIDAYVDAGPGRVLAKLVKRNLGAAVREPARA
ncbi:MAG TPA: ACP S-malonyltransferase [Solirubrobacteraceae bacterium]|nr:ACP S-malonyltransferase [Solirubrobacteraceae bacterium]